jgi:hypothetical protein
VFDAIQAVEDYLENEGKPVNPILVDAMPPGRRTHGTRDEPIII